MNIVLEPTFTDVGILSSMSAVVLQHDKLICVSLSTQDMSEKDILLRIQSTFHSDKNVRLCGWESRAHMNKILMRCMYYGIQFPWYYNDRFGPRYRYSVDHQLDLFDFLTEYGTIERKLTLSLALKSIFGSSYSLEATEAAPAPSHARCLVSTILALRAELLRGGLTPQRHNHFIEQLWLGAEASLSSAKMMGRSKDALGIDFTVSNYTDVKHGYTQLLQIFPTPPVVIL